MIISVDAEKASDKNLLSVYNLKKKKNSSEIQHRGNIPKQGKAIYERHTQSIILNSEKLKAFRLKIRNNTRMSTVTTFIQHRFGSPSHCSQRRK